MTPVARGPPASPSPKPKQSKKHEGDCEGEAGVSTSVQSSGNQTPADTDHQDRRDQIDDRGAQALPEGWWRGWWPHRTGQVLEHRCQVSHGPGAIRPPYSVFQLVQRQTALGMVLAEFIHHRLAIRIRSPDRGRTCRTPHGTHGPIVVHREHQRISGLRWGALARVGSGRELDPKAQGTHPRSRSGQLHPHGGEPLQDHTLGRKRQIGLRGT